MSGPSYSASVFLNVPFDDAYRPIFNALVFTVFDCGFVARSAWEEDDFSVVRVEKLYGIIRACKYGIHDISRAGLDPKTRLARFNMPLELGIFLAAKKYGAGRQRTKCAVVLDRDRYRYHRFCSDVAGQDVRSYKGRRNDAIRCVRNWLASTPDRKRTTVPGASYLQRRFRQFLRQLPALCQGLKLDPDDLPFNDYTTLVSAWLDEHPR